MPRYTKETSQKLDQVAKYIISQVAYRRKPVSFAEVSKECDIKYNLLVRKPLIIKGICETLLQSNRVIDVDVCYFEQEFDVVLKPIYRCA